MKILVVDDDKTIRRVIDQCVTALGHDVFHAENGAEGLAFVKESNVELILMDIEMPGFKGFEATKADEALYNLKENGCNRVESA